MRCVRARSIRALCRDTVGLLSGEIVTQEKAHYIVQWFASCGDRYVRAYLAHIDVQRLATDRHYGLKLFFFQWAFERSGAPRAYRIAAVKAVSSLKDSQAELPELFGQFCAGKADAIESEPESRFWKKGNIPAVDPKIKDFDVCEIVRLVKKGALSDAFKKLELKGMGHKLKAFFLRDLVTLLKAEPKLDSDCEAYLWCQPIDVWVRLAASELCKTETPTRIRGDSGKYHLNGADLAKARAIINLSLDANVSPLSVNQGIWYFSANAIADEKRLRELIRSGDSKNLEAEIALMEGFLPTRPML